MNKTIKKITIYILSLIIFTIIYITSFHLNITKIIPVYTYCGIFNIFIITILLSLFLIIIKKHSNMLDIKDCVIICLLFFSINIYFFSMIPVTLERSISVFMLNEFDKKEYSKEEIEQVFIDKYVYDNNAFEKRFKEQEYTGTIKYNDEKYTLSKKGKKMLKLFKIIKKIYNVKGNILS